MPENAYIFLSGGLSVKRIPYRITSFMPPVYRVKVKKGVSKKVRIWSRFLLCQLKADSPYGFDIISASGFNQLFAKIADMLF